MADYLDGEGRCLTVHNRTKARAEKLLERANVIWCASRCRSRLSSGRRMTVLMGICTGKPRLLSTSVYLVLLIIVSGPRLHL